jgi:hypothetical protein
MQMSTSQNAMGNSTRDHYRSKFLNFILLIFPGIVLLLYGYLGGYARLIADDFCSFYFARRLSILRFIWYWYLNWGGRYTAFAVDSLVENIGVEGLPYYPASVLMIWVVIATFTFYVLLQAEIGKRPGILLALAMGTTAVFVLLSISPTPQDTLYWWNGMRSYLPALIVATFHIGFLYWARENLKTRNAILLGSLTSFAIALVNAGGNEAFSVILVLSFTGFTALALLTGKLRFNDPFFYMLSAAMLGNLLGFLIVLASPGAEIRQAFFPPPPSIPRTLELAVRGYLEFWVNLVSSPQRITALIAMVLTSIWIGTTSEHRSSNGYLIPLSIASGILLSFLSVVPAVYATSDVPPPRLLILSSFIIEASFFYGGCVTGKLISGNMIASTPLNSGLMWCVGISIALSSLMNAKFLYDSRDIYISFAHRWDQANAQIVQAKLNGAESVTIPAMNVWTGPGGDPTDNPRYWVTACYSLYYDFPVFGPSLNSGTP